MADPWSDAFAATRTLGPTDHEVRRVLALDRARASRGRAQLRRIIAVSCAAVLLGAGTYAVPATRAAVATVYSSIASWIEDSGGDGAPGRAVAPGDAAPAWLRHAPGAPRVIAENGRVKLFAAIEADGRLSLALGDSVGLTSSLDSMRKQFADHAIVVLGPGSFPDGPLDRRGRRPLFGLVSRPVTRIELRYRSGAPTSQARLRGGFVLLSDAKRSPSALIAYDAAGRSVERLDVSDLDLRVCRDVRGCPPGSWLP